MIVKGKTPWLGLNIPICHCRLPNSRAVSHSDSSDTDLHDTVSNPDPCTGINQGTIDIPNPASAGDSVTIETDGENHPYYPLVGTNQDTAPNPTSTATSESFVKFQPPLSYTFLPRTYGKTHVKQRRCLHQWFREFPWMHYDEARDVVFCHTCITATKKKLLSFTRRYDDTFISEGFHNWNDGLRTLKGHNASNVHKEATEKLLVDANYSGTVACLLDKEISTEKALANRMIVEIVKALKFLTRQNLGIRGSTVIGTFEPNSNFWQLLQLLAVNNLELKTWLERPTNYTSPEVQNELLSIMSNMIVRDIIAQIKASDNYCIMIDESTDNANKEQAAFCLRWVDEDLQPNEEFLGLYQLATTSADSLVHMIKHCLLRFGLPLANSRGQCYDGAAAMAGKRKGVAMQISAENPKCLFVHCYAHSLNLAVQDMVKTSNTIKDCLNISYEVTKLIRFSPKRDAKLAAIQEEDCYNVDDEKSHYAKIRLFCATRWTVKAATLGSIIANYKCLQTLWESVLEERAADAEIMARIIGVNTKMQTFHYLYGLLLAEMIFRQTDNLSRALQGEQLSAADGQRLAQQVITTLRKLRSDRDFDLFFAKVEQKRVELNIPEGKTSRPRKRPARFDENRSTYTHITNIKEESRVAYFEALDLAINGILNRFDQPGYKIYMKLENILLKASKNEPYEEELKSVREMYESDIEMYALETELITLSRSGVAVHVRSVKEFLGLYKSNMNKVLYPQLGKILKLILVLPATNAVSERSFSAMRRVKTFLRSSMSQQRLNNTMMLHVHRERLDQLDEQSVISEFVSHHTNRKDKIGTVSTPVP